MKGSEYFNPKWLDRISGSPHDHDVLDAYYVYRSKDDAERALHVLANCDNVPLQLVNHLRAVANNA